MKEYQPSSRRPIASALRRTAEGAVRVCVRRGVHPDMVSYLSIAASLGAAACFCRASAHPWLLLVGPLLCYLRLWFNMLDGMVALAAKSASHRGEIINDLPDRVSDVAIFVGVAHSGLCSPISGYWAAILALLTAYVGILGQAVGARRSFAGIMSKPWRMVTLHVGAWIAWLVLAWNEGTSRALSWTVLDWTCLAVVAGCLQTIVARLTATFDDLREQEAARKDERDSR